ncbi:MAG: hypothetical protein RML57_09680 [Acidobacteriota bacterium]|nr:hypothetical protein [Acidobacteriota bacterium]
MVGSPAWWALSLNAATALYMTGVIWLVQRVHYPLLRYVGAESFADYHHRHVAAIFPVVAPPMLVEGVAAVWLVFQPPVGVSRWVLWGGLACVLTAFGVTALVSIPCHDRLAAQGFDGATLERLVSTNWLRTLAWTLHGVLSLAALVQFGCQKR